MPLPDEFLTRKHGNSLITEEMNYDVVELKNLLEEQVRAMNPNQKLVFSAVMDFIKNNNGKLFFVSGHG